MEVSTTYIGDLLRETVEEVSKPKNLKYKVGFDKSLEVQNYLNGIRELERKGNMYFGIEGSLRIENGFVSYQDNLVMSKNEELNKFLMEGLAKRLE